MKQQQTPETMTDLQKSTIHSMFLNVKKHQPNALLRVGKVGYADRVSVIIVTLNKFPSTTYREFYARCELNRLGNIVCGKFNKLIPIKEDEVKNR